MYVQQQQKFKEKLSQFCLSYSTWSSYCIIPKKTHQKMKFDPPINLHAKSDDREKPILDDVVVVVVVAPPS